MNYTGQPRCYDKILYASNIDSNVTKAFIWALYEGNETMDEIHSPNLVAQFYYATYILIGVFILLGSTSIFVGLLYNIWRYSKQRFNGSLLLASFYILSSLDMLVFMV